MTDTHVPARRKETTGPGLGVVVGLLVIYLAVHLGLRLVVSDSVDVDESDIILFGQSLEWGYHEQPPLYSWGVWVLSRVFGVNIVTITLFRLLVLGTTHLLLYLCTWRATRDRRAALLAAFALFAVPTFAWNAVAYLTHTVLACALTVAACHALFCLRDRGWTCDYLYLGLVFGLGCLSKYNFALPAAGLLTAGLSVPSFRARLLDPRALMAFLVAALLVTPHGLWLLAHWQPVREGIAIKSQATGPGSLVGVARGAASLGLNLVLILVPLVPAFFLFFPAALHRPEGAPRSRAAYCLLLERYFLVSAGLLLTHVALGGASRFHERWLQPVLVLTPVYLFSRLRPGELRAGHARLFAGGLALLAVAVTVGRAAQIWVGGLDRGAYPLQMALSGPAQELRAAGFEQALVLAHDREIAGNVRLLFPNAHVFCSAQPHYLPTAYSGDIPAFLVWNTQMGWGPSGANPPRSLEHFLIRTLSLRREPGTEVLFVDVPPEIPGRPVNRIAVLRLWGPPGVARSH